MEPDDYCDACPAIARVKPVAMVILSNGGELTLCGHHTDEKRDALKAKGAVVLDSRTAG